MNNSHGKESIISVGTTVYFPCKQNGWAQGVVTTVTSSAVMVKSSNGQVKDVTLDSIEISTSMQDLADVCDLTKISPLSTPAVLQCLHSRFNNNKVYTKAGSTLVAVNPFNNISKLYGKDVISEIHFRSVPSSVEKDQAPHVYEVAEKTYQRLQSAVDKKSQSIIVSGESGAGKTVSARHLMKYLVCVSSSDLEHRQEYNQHTDCSLENQGRLIEDRILGTNTILEAFGNATTTRNNNSSRFGKYVELYFDRCHNIVGASIKTYLLEKCRVVHQAPDEYNFHVFYQILTSCGTLIEELCGDVIEINVDTFKIARTQGRFTDFDKQKYSELENALLDIGLTSREIADIIMVLVSVMLLCNLGFVSDDEHNGNDGCYLNEEQIDLTDKVAELLGLTSSKLETTFTHRKITATHTRRKSVYHKPCGVAEAENRRDCMAKVLYDRLFEWIVKFINIHIKGPADCDNLDKIGILDIYGFESFKNNGLEQLCINYANEKLQQHFVTHFMRELQEEYIKEAIPWEVSDFVDNRMCIELIEGKPGIVALLDEECNLNRPIDNTALSERLIGSLQGLNKHIHKATKNLHQPGFMVLHYAEPVKYNTECLLEKNKDNIPVEIEELLQQSDNVFICSFINDLQPEQNGKKKKTVLSKFKQSLDSLMLTLEKTEPHYIRCIKPNTQSKAGVFDRKYVLSQLLACGVVETVNINKQAFPAKMTYPDFLKHFSLILRQKPQGTNKDNLIENNNDMCYEPLDILYNKQLDLTPRKSHSAKKSQRRRAGLSSGDHNRKLCATIMKAVFKSEYTNNMYTQFGKTQLFLRDGQLEQIEAVRLKCLSENAFTIQCAWRSYINRKRRKMTGSICCLQAVIRGWLQRNENNIQNDAAIVIQRSYRRRSNEKKEILRYHNSYLHSKQNVQNDLVKTMVCSNEMSTVEALCAQSNKTENVGSDGVKMCSYSDLSENSEGFLKEQFHCHDNCYPGKVYDTAAKEHEINTYRSGSTINGAGKVKQTQQLNDSNKDKWSIQSVMSSLCRKDVVVLSAVVAVALILRK